MKKLIKRIDWINLLTYAAIFLVCVSGWGIIAGYLLSNLTIMFSALGCLLLSLCCIIRALVLFKRNNFQK